MVKPLRKVKIHPGSSVQCEQSKSIERVRVNKFFNRLIIRPPSGTVSVNVASDISHYRTVGFGLTD